MSKPKVDSVSTTTFSVGTGQYDIEAVVTDNNGKRDIRLSIKEPHDQENYFCFSGVSVLDLFAFEESVKGLMERIRIWQEKANG